MATRNPNPNYASDSDSDDTYDDSDDYDTDDDSDADPAVDDVVEEPLGDVIEVPPIEIDDDDEEEEERGRDGDASGTEERMMVDASMGLNCPICFEPWTPEGPHRVCCIPCGHVYGRSCLEKWFRKCRNNSVKCPTCKRMTKQREIVNLYAPLVAVQNDELEREVRTLRQKNEQLQLEKANLVAEVSLYKKHQIDRENYDRPKKACIDQTSPGGTQRMFGYYDEKTKSSQNLLEKNFPIQTYCSVGYQNCSFVLQNELAIEGARVMAIDAINQILLVSGKKPGVSGEHVLNKISLLAPYEVHKIMLPPNTGPIKDMCVLPNGVALFASLGKKLTLFSTGTNNLVLKYDLPGPAWSCSGDCTSQYHIYAGLKNGTLLVFDIRQTATHLVAMEGLSRHPIHTVHSIADKKVLTASSVGPCVWDVNGSGGRPCLVPEMENHGVCIALACSSSKDDIVASFRPKVELHHNSILPSQLPLSAPNPLSGTGKLGAHALIKMINGVSFQKQVVASGTVSEARMSKSVIISSEGNNPLFAYGDESTHGLCLWDLPSLKIYKRLKPHQHPILDLKYARSAGPGFLGSISEDRLQVFTCF